MKAVFTCDDVFDTLTREPFPSGAADDEIVESHLAVCHECRRLAEAFRPAVGLFHESLSVESDDELPMYRGRLQPIIDELSPHDRAQPVVPRTSVTMFLLAVAAGLMLVGSVVLATFAAKPQSGRAGHVVTNVHLHENRDYTLLAALEIPAACRSIADTSNVATADIACCTECHSANSQVGSTQKAILKTSAACVACHDGMLGNSFSAFTPRWRGSQINYDQMRVRFRERLDAISARLSSGSATLQFAIVLTSCSRDPENLGRNAKLAKVLDTSVRGDSPCNGKIFSADLNGWALHTTTSLRSHARRQRMVACESDRLC